MKVKFIGATPEEDKVVEIPEGTGTIEIPLPEKEGGSMWPVAAVMITFAVCFTVVMVALLGGFRG